MLRGHRGHRRVANASCQRTDDVLKAETKLKSTIPQDGVPLLQVSGKFTRPRKDTTTAQALHSQKGSSTCFSKIGSKASTQQGGLEFRADWNLWDWFSWIKMLAMPLCDVVAECIH